ncbi:hypothetical protein CHS0354_009162 [Potamilus streckersoni]|uniref:Cilia- and flagella-associated protein 300 n=1 Tax=Potamilus streckersoni TaxID=2493646 RepID=A0AAE0VMG0_9BIVA|nr:hypothetical protein CHS0354_009162 [Potamilus streckersoni]
MADRVPKFRFQLLDKKKFNSIEDKTNQEYLIKWSLKESLKAQMFSFDQSFQPYEKDTFVLDFFKDPNVISTLQVASDKGKSTPLCIAADKVSVEVVPCRVLSMSFFDRLYDHEIVRESGHIHKCLDEYYEGIQISDELRKVLLLEESDNYEIFNESDREEFLFRLFKHLCIGGAVCQYEDTIDPYLNITKLLYKDIVSVQKNPETKELSIISSVFKVTAMDKDDIVYYPAEHEHEQNFSYLIVDPMKRHVIVLYHKIANWIF